VQRQHHLGGHDKAAENDGQQKHRQRVHPEIPKAQADEKYQHAGEHQGNDQSGKKILPGAYTFILEGTREVPKRLLHEKKKTIGLRISHHGVVQALLTSLSEPMMSVSLILEGREFYDVDDVRDAVENQVDVIIDDGYCPPEPTTVIDLTSGGIEIIRQGAGDTSLLE